MELTLVTGAAGFVGRALVDELVRRDRLVRAVTRSAADIRASEIVVSPSWAVQGLALSAFRGVTQVVHTAARVHVMRERATDPLAEFRAMNVDATLRLARTAVEAGVRRFVFISSIKVNGERTAEGRAFRAADTPAPREPYGISKLEAEVGLQAIGAQSGMEICIIRPVLVYGPGVRGNFETLLRWVARGIPLPLGAVHNKRSLVSLYNLVDLLVTCTTHHAAANQVFLVSDGEDLSTTELLLRIGRAVGNAPVLFPVPEYVLRLGAKIVGKEQVVERVLGSLQVDIAKTREVLQWAPPMGVDAALAATARATAPRD